MSSKVLTVTDVCVYLHISRSTLYRMLTRRNIPAFRVAGNWRFNIDELKSWIERKSQSSDLI